MQITVASRSDKGPIRPINQDVLAAWEPKNPDDQRYRGAVILIADGVGGSLHGEIAAKIAADTAIDTFRTLKPGTSLNGTLWRMINNANNAVYDAGSGPQGEGLMQTTLTAVVLRNDQIGVGHVGDCRAYLIQSGASKCLTTDHNFVAFHERIGLFNAPREGGTLMRGGLTRCLGKDLIATIDFTYASVDAGDYIVLCCDGVHTYVTEGEIAEIVTHHPPQDACDIIFKLALSRGTEDNVSIQICRIDRIQHVDYYRGMPVFREEKPKMGHELEVGDVLDDRFEILQVISRSGMASIFKALDRLDNTQVALKVPFMQYESDPAFYSRFQREEEIGRALAHPCILKIIAVDEDKKSRPYIAMELLSGKTLDEVMRNEHPMSVSKAMSIVAKICDALEYMHEKDIVHRDLKPSNIMVCEDGSLRIMDFGIAKAAGMRRVTFTGFSPAMGTPDYMAPEQVKGRRGDRRSDIYSLGAILYEMVTGHTPFEGQNPFLIMQARITGDPEAPTNFNPDITHQLEEIILHAMEREPRNRYPAAQDMAAELRDPDHVIITGRVSRLQVPHVGRIRWRAVRLWLLLALVPAAFVILAILASRGHR
jgi:serine/threonine protein phosphatase PrpC